MAPSLGTWMSPSRGTSKLRVRMHSYQQFDSRVQLRNSIRRRLTLVLEFFHVPVDAKNNVAAGFFFYFVTTENWKTPKAVT
jgi:hypothetical protein